MSDRVGEGQAGKDENPIQRGPYARHAFEGQRCRKCGAYRERVAFRRVGREFFRWTYPDGTVKETYISQKQPPCLEGRI